VPERQHLYGGEGERASGNFHLICPVFVEIRSSSMAAVCVSSGDVALLVGRSKKGEACFVFNPLVAWFA
jgi:hypothetical protein